MIVHGDFGGSDKAVSMLPRKAAKRYVGVDPYRKPTQVVGLSILRRASDARLRN